VPAAFSFSTGNPDGKMATITEPANAQNSNVEFETGDDFLLSTETQITGATFTGLLTGTATTTNVSNVVVEIYQVFPKGSNTSRTPNVPTRVNSPSDLAFVVRDSTANDLSFTPNVLSPVFTATNSVSSSSRIAVNSGGNGTISGEEVQFNVTFSTPLDLPPDHYFFVPQVGLTATTLATDHFLWLSAPKPIVSPGTPFAPDLQSWMRDDPSLAPDWLRIGTDIVGTTATPTPTFNATFSLTGQTFPLSVSSLSQNSAPEGSPNLSLTVNGSNFTAQSTVLFNGLPLTTTFVNATQLQALIPLAFLAEEGSANISVIDAQRGLSNGVSFSITENKPTLRVKLRHPTQSQVFLKGLVIDQALERHSLRVDWGDGTIDVFNLGVGDARPFSVGHRYHNNGLVKRLIMVTALDDEGTPSARAKFLVLV
jgi:hypothetical protein